MAEKRMFTKKIIDSDAFLDMPSTSRLLYYDLCMRADDDGFVSSPKKICKMSGATEDDLKLLILKRFVIAFPTGLIVIKHWWLHNYIQKDRYHETVYLEEKSQLTLKENKVYTEKQNAEIETSKTKHKYGEYKNVLLSDEDMEKLKSEFPNDYQQRIEECSSYCASKGKSYSNYLATIRNWARKDVPKQEDALPVYDTSKNRPYSEEEEEELMRAMGGKQYERWKKEHGRE